MTERKYDELTVAGVFLIILSVLLIMTKCGTGIFNLLF